MNLICFFVFVKHVLVPSCISHLRPVIFLVVVASIFTEFLSELPVDPFLIGVADKLDKALADAIRPGYCVVGVAVKSPYQADLFTLVY